jgi:hypothetical protein
MHSDIALVAAAAEAMSPFCDADASPSECRTLQCLGISSLELQHTLDEFSEAVRKYPLFATPPTPVPPPLPGDGAAVDLGNDLTSVQRPETPPPVFDGRKVLLGDFAQTPDPAPGQRRGTIIFNPDGTIAGRSPW